MELLPAGNGLSVFQGIRNYMDDPLGVPPMEIPTMITFPTVKDRAYHRSKNQAGGAYETAQLLCLASSSWFGKPQGGVGASDWTPAWKHPTRTPEYKELKKKW